jgi:hypothetical protein
VTVQVDGPSPSHGNGDWDRRSARETVTRKNITQPSGRLLPATATGSGWLSQGIASQSRLERFPCGPAGLRLRRGHEAAARRPLGKCSQMSKRCSRSLRFDGDVPGRLGCGEAAERKALHGRCAMAPGLGYFHDSMVKGGTRPIFD